MLKLFFFWALLVLSSGATALSMKPSSLELQVNGGIAELELTNDGETFVYLELSAGPWKVVEGDEPERLQKEVFVYPRAFPLPAGASQTVRVIHRHGSSQKPIYARLAVTQKPSKGFVSAADNLATGYSIPLFVQDLKESPNVQMDLVVLDDGRNVLQLINRGSRVLDLREYRWRGGEATPTQKFIFPNQPRRLLVEGDATDQLWLRFRGTEWRYTRPRNGQ